MWGRLEWKESLQIVKYLFIISMLTSCMVRSKSWYFGSRVREMFWILNCSTFCDDIRKNIFLVYQVGIFNKSQENDWFIKDIYTTLKTALV